ncbi:MAG: hypothetical protein ACI31C_07855 [Muribaculaceae bacterium]
MCTPGDAVMCDGVDSRWLANMQAALGVCGEPWNHDPADYCPTPWGWSQATRRTFEINGFADSALPSYDDLDRMRNLSHRRTAAAVARELQKKLDFEVWSPAVEVDDVDTLHEMLAGGVYVVKAPWSSSGRGITFSTPATAEQATARLAGTIRSQGSVMVEPMAQRAIDFAMLFNYDRGECTPAGLSLFKTAPGGEYLGNVVDSQDAIADVIGQHCSAEHLNAIARALPAALTTVIGTDYCGPIGVDMLADVDGVIDPVVEINFRYTMGFVALGLHRYVDAPATFTVQRGAIAANSRAIIYGSKLRGGTLPLTPPGGDFSFLLTVD